MELMYAELSSPGPVREKNCDFVGFWQPLTPEQKRSQGAVIALADGVEERDQGEVASRLAVETALAAFRDAPEEMSLQQLISLMFDAANSAVYDKSQAGEQGRMAASLCLVILRNGEIVIGNAGSSRVYLVRAGEIRQLSTDHTYTGMLRKCGLINEEEAAANNHRSVLTSCVGQMPVIRIDAERIAVLQGDRIVLCSDGLYGYVSDSEIAETVSRLSPAQACRHLVAFAESHGTSDCLSVQVIHISEIDNLTESRDVPISSEAQPKPSGYDLQPGQTLDDRFYLADIISKSGMATIFKATDLLTRQDVAVKVPYMQFESSPAFYSRFAREGMIGEQLNHPYLLKFIPVEKRSRPYLVSEYLRGYTLAHLLKKVRIMPEKDALGLAGRICEALSYMHEQGVIHRDLKPQNVMLCYDGTIRILDFGISKSIGKRFTFTGFTPAIGTPEYMAPEQVKGRRGDERTDIYSLGVMLYEMVTGVIPFASADKDVFAAMNARVTGDPVAPRKHNPHLSEQVEEIILHAMEREPKNRYRNILEMKEELDNPDRVQLTGRWQRLQVPCPWKRHAKNVLLIGSVIAGIIFGFVQLILLIMRRGP